MVHFRRQFDIQVVTGKTQTVSVNPTQVVKIKAEGNGTLTITFATQVPQQLSQFVTAQNQVTIPVVGEIKLTLFGVSSITVTGNVVVHVTEEAHGVLQVQPEVEVSDIQNTVTVQVSNNTITSVISKGQQLPPVNIIHVGFEPITFAGSGVSFTVQDYDPVTGVPAGPPIQVNLIGSSSYEAEYPTGSTVLESRTGFIIISNISGTGYFHIFKAKPN